MAGNMTNADRDEIVTKNVAFGMSHSEIARTLGWSESAVSLTLKCLDLVKAENWNQLIYKIKACNWSMALIEWAAERTARKIPPEVYEAVKDRTAKRKAWAVQTDPQQEDAPPAPGPNDAVFLVKVLEQMEALIKSNNAIVDALSALAADIKDNVNLNSDLICERLKEVGLSVEAIKNNTRKKGL